MRHISDSILGIGHFRWAGLCWSGSWILWTFAQPDSLFAYNFCWSGLLRPCHIWHKLYWYMLYWSWLRLLTSLVIATLVPTMSIACIPVTSSHLVPRQMHNVSNADLIYYLRCISGHHQMRRVVYYGARNLMGETLMICGSNFHCLHTKHYTAWICLH